MIKKLNHVAIVVKDLEKTLESLQATFGAKMISRVVYQDQGFVSALIAIGESQFEVLASCGAGSMIEKYLDVHAEGIHHVSLQVNDFDGTIKDFKDKGLKVIGEVDTPEFKAAFIHPSTNFGVLMEILELKSSEQSSEEPLTTHPEGVRTETKE